MNFKITHFIKQRTNLYLKLNNNGCCIQIILKKCAMVFQHNWKYHEISSVERCGRLINVLEWKFVIS
jgi:hypothetical protein